MFSTGIVRPRLPGGVGSLLCVVVLVSVAAADSPAPPDGGAEARLFEKGQRLLWQGQYREAEKVFADLIDKNKSAPQGAYLNRALCRRYLHNWKGALEDYDRCLERNRDCPPAILGRSACYLDMGDSKKALDELKRLDESTNELVRQQMLFQRGLAYQKLADYPQAILNLSSTLTGSDPFLPAYGARAETYRLWGEAFVREKKPVQAKEVFLYALDDFDTAREHFPKNWVLLAGRGRLWQALGTLTGIRGDFVSAVEDFSKALALRKDDPELYWRRAQCHLELANPDGAFDDYTTAANTGTIWAERVTDDLAERLRDPRAEVRKIAARMLGRLKDRADAALEALATAVEADTDADVRATVAFTLGEVTSRPRVAVPALAKALSDDNSRVRREAAKSLAQCYGRASASAAEPLRTALKDSDVLIRLYSAQALWNGTQNATDVLPVLQALLVHSNAMVRRSATATLGGIGLSARAAVPSLVKVLNEDRDSMVRREAAHSLGLLAPVAEEAIPDMILLLGMSDAAEEIRLEVAASLGEMGPAARKALPALETLLRSERPQSRVVAVATLGRIAPDAEAALEPLLKALKDREPAVRLESARALSGMLSHADKVVPVLIKALADRTLPCRLEVIHSLGLLGPEAEEAIPILLDELKSTHEAVRAATAAALGQIGENPKAVVPALTALLADPIPTVRTVAAHALGGFGSRAKSALPNLREARKSKDPMFREASERALKQIEPGKELAAETERLVDKPTLRIAYYSPNSLDKELQALREELDWGSPSGLVSRISTLQEMDEGASAVPILSGQLASASEKTRLQAVRLLGLIGPPAREAVTLLLNLLNRGGIPEQIEVILALGRIGPGAQQAVPHLKERLGHQDWRIRLAAIQAFRNLGPVTGTRPTLGIYRADSADLERIALLRTVNAVAPSVLSGESLVKALEDPHPHVRYWAADTLGRRERLSKSAIPALETLAGEKEPSAAVQRRAKSAIEKILANEGE